MHLVYVTLVPFNYTAIFMHLLLVWMRFEVVRARAAFPPPNKKWSEKKERNVEVFSCGFFPAFLLPAISYVFLLFSHCLLLLPFFPWFFAHLTTHFYLSWLLFGCNGSLIFIFFPHNALATFFPPFVVFSFSDTLLFHSFPFAVSLSCMVFVFLGMGHFMCIMCCFFAVEVDSHFWRVQLHGKFSGRFQVHSAIWLNRFGNWPLEHHRFRDKRKFDWIQWSRAIKQNKRTHHSLDQHSTCMHMFNGPELTMKWNPSSDGGI